MGFPRMVVKCVDDRNAALTYGEEYDVERSTARYYFVTNDDGGTLGYAAERFKVIQVGLTRAQESEKLWEMNENACRLLGEEELPPEQPSQKAIDSHYNFSYSLTQDDIDKGTIKLDPYFVSAQWQIGSKDPSGVIWHIFKTCARFGEKNDKAREIKAIYKSIKRLAELENVNLE